MLKIDEFMSINNSKTRLELAHCSYIAESATWSTLLGNVMRLAIHLADINKELAQLERKLILCFSIANICLFVDIHVNINRGTLSTDNIA